MSNQGERCARWLLYEIAAEDRPTERGMTNTYMKEFDVEFRIAIERVGVGLRWLKNHGLAEKWRPPSLKPATQQPWRLTPAGRQALEDRLRRKAEREYAEAVDSLHRVEG